MNGGGERQTDKMMKEEEGQTHTHRQTDRQTETKRQRYRDR